MKARLKLAIRKSIRHTFGVLGCLIWLTTSFMLMVIPALWLGPNKWFPYAGEVQTIQAEAAHNELLLLYYETGILKITPYLWDMDDQMLAIQTSRAVEIKDISFVHRLCLRSSHAVAGEPIQEQFTGWPFPWLRSSWPVDRPANVSPWGLNVDGVSPTLLLASIVLSCSASVVAEFVVTLLILLVTQLISRTKPTAESFDTSIRD